MVQWLGLCTSTVEGTSSIPGQRNKILQAAWCSQTTTTTKTKKFLEESWLYKLYKFKFAVLRELYLLYDIKLNVCNYWSCFFRIMLLKFNLVAAYFSSFFLFWLLFHYMAILQFLYPFTRLMDIWLFPVLDHYWNNGEWNC